MLIMGLGVSFLLVTGLLRLTGEFDHSSPADIHPAIVPQKTLTEPLGESVELQLPARIPGTDLVAERLVNYEGPFIEDGSDTPVSNIAALIIRNIGTNSIREGSVTVSRGEKYYVFAFSYILPGMSVMVLESSAAPCFQDGITQISGWTNPLDKSCRISDLSFNALDMGRLTVTNLSENPLENIRLYHKNILQDGTYVGGVTYCTAIEILLPGETIAILPDHYADGYSKIFYAE